MRKQGSLQIKGYIISDAEFNLATMFQKSIQEAFDRFPKSKMVDVASALGISSRTLHRICKEWNIVRPKKSEQIRKNKRDLARMGVTHC